MVKFVPDIKTQRWIIIAPSRQDRPDDAKKPEDKGKCPFCEGNEYMTPPEIYRIGEDVANSPGWKIRVIPNLFPITDIHEVIIHSPVHDKDLADFTHEQVSLLITVYRERFKLHMNDGQVMIFSNHGHQAGASLVHPHSQLVVIPRQINLDALVREPIINVVEDNHFFVTYCPDFSQWPYEVWVAPKKEGTNFADITNEEIMDFASILKKTIQKLEVCYRNNQLLKTNDSGPFAFNFYIHHAKNWFIRIIPRLVHRAGFELGTGLSVNVVDPALAASELRQTSV